MTEDLDVSTTFFTCPGK